jgi:hypothetical protein
LKIGKRWKNLSREDIMKLCEIQELFVQEAIDVDPRGKEAVKLDLKKRNESYDELSQVKKSFFDVESLKNPYYDSRILYGNPDTDVKSIFVGIDIETPEILLAKRLIDSKVDIDLIIAHHPEGYAYATFAKIGAMQTDILHRFGVPANVADKLVYDRIKEVTNSVHPSNTERACDAAKLLDIPYMTAHSVADNHVASFLQREIDAINPYYVGDIICLLTKQPEYTYAAHRGLAPYILIGCQYSRCGKVFVDMTGGFEGPVGMYEKLSNAGIGTIISMHLTKDAAEQAQKHNLNVIIAGHIASDNIGLNLMFDKLEAKLGKVNFVEASGFRRFRR